jgi:hypothetical protein
MNQEADLEALVRILDLPDRVADRPGADDWLAAEGAVGRPLPPDFKAFLHRYGSGRIDGFLHVLNPVASREPVRLVPAMERLLGGLRALRSDAPEEVPYSLHPESGGLLPWAVSDNGDVFFWSTEATDPAAWSIVVSAAGGPGWATHPGPMVRFLAELLTRAYRVPFLPSTWPSARPSFEPSVLPLQWERLRRLLPPPDRPVAVAGLDDRDRIEASLEVRLPADYWWFQASYGAGTLGGDLRVFAPAELAERHGRFADVLALVGERRPGEVPFPVRPGPGGLLAWGGTDAGVMGFWLTAGPDPDVWPIVARDATRSEWFTHRGPLAWFLADLMDGAVTVSFLPGGVAGRQFEPG